MILANTLARTHVKTNANLASETVEIRHTLVDIMAQHIVFDYF